MPANTSSMLESQPLGLPTIATGGLVQLVERRLCKADARGSNPRSSTTYSRMDRRSLLVGADLPLVIQQEILGYRSLIEAINSGLALLTVGNGGKGTLPWRFVGISVSVIPGKFDLHCPRLSRG